MVSNWSGEKDINTPTHNYGRQVQKDIFPGFLPYRSSKMSQSIMGIHTPADEGRVNLLCHNQKKFSLEVGSRSKRISLE